MEKKKYRSPLPMAKEGKEKTPSSPMAGIRPRAYYETQDQTSIYEEYLFGKGTYAAGSDKRAWSDTTKGRIGIRLISRGLFGAAAFAWGGYVARKHLINYEPTTFLHSENKKGLQYIAYAFDTTLGRAISGFARTIAPKGQKAQWAKDAVRFRTKGYFHSTPNVGIPAGRSLGAEIVAVTFDFAGASVGDATARNIIQAFDPSLQKPWLNEEGKFDPARLTKSIATTAWRIFSKNQMEDWVAAVPYVYQMKWQRQAIAKYWPGFKLVSDNAWNGGSMTLDRQGNITGDYQMPGLLDLQFRFAGYNWYTLMYREAYDSVKRTFADWKDHGFKLKLSAPQQPLEAAANLVIQPIRYAAKSFIKAHIYMIPSVPFFWMWRTPQSRWKASPILDQNIAKDGENAIASLGPRDHHINIGEYMNREWQYSTSAIAEKSTDTKKALMQGGINTNPGQTKKVFYFGPEEVLNKIGFGVDVAVYKFKNQKTLAGKLLNPFGWISYKLGSGAVNMLNRIDPRNKFFKFMGSTHLMRELNMRNYVDASLSYTPYFIAKTELGLRVDDRGPGGGPGRMDNAIYGAIDHLATFNMKGFQRSVGRIVDLLAHPTTDLKMREGDAKNVNDIAPSKPAIPSMKQTPGSVVHSATPQLGIEARRNFSRHDQPKEPPSHWAQSVQKERDQTTRLLYPPHQTLQ